VHLFHYHLVTSKVRQVEARYLGKLGFDLVGRHGRIADDLTSFEAGSSWEELDRIGFKLRLAELERGGVNIVVQPGQWDLPRIDHLGLALDEDDFQATLDQLDGLLPGGGPLVERLDRFRAAFIVQPARLADVFERAIDECRRQTRERVSLPDDESFTVEYVTDKPWSGYNWYKGGHRSVIQVNTDLPIYIDRAIDLAAHEGYPGHHLFNLLLEQRMVEERGWVEFTVYPLFSPESLIAEGTANFGIEVAFPGDSRVRFDRDVLMPLAGLPVADADRYGAVMRLVSRLSYAGNEAARRYLDGSQDRSATAEWLTRFALMSPARAEQRTRFMDAYRSYVINYNLGQDLVRDYIEARGGTAANPDRRWDLFLALLQSPRLPSELR